jgi:hypothetical protein
VLIVIAVIAAWMLSGACLYGRSHGLGLHIWNLDSNVVNLPGETGLLTKVLFTCYIAYSTAITFTKCSIIASYIRIFQHDHVRRVSYAIGIIVVAFWICYIFAICFTCIPIQALWDYTIPRKCVNITAFFYVAAGINILTDLSLCILPLPTLWSLRLPFPQRVTVCLLFSMGLLYVHICYLSLTITYSDEMADFHLAHALPASSA